MPNFWWTEEAQDQIHQVSIAKDETQQASEGLVEGEEADIQRSEVDKEAKQTEWQDRWGVRVTGKRL